MRQLHVQLLNKDDGLEDIWNLFNTNQIPNHNWNNVSHAKFYGDDIKRQGNNQIQRNAPAPTIRAEHHGNIGVFQQ